MNKTILTGRITKDPEVKQTPSNVAVCSFNLAVDRRFKSQNGEKQTDFIACVAWRQQATLIGNYCHKGSKIGVVGSIQTRSYDDQNGQRRNVTEVVIDEIEFLDPKNSTASQDDNYQPVPVPPTPAQEEDVALPFDLGY